MNSCISKEKVLFEMSFPELHITEKNKKSIIKQNNNNSNYRIRKGLFYTEEQKQKYIEESLKRRLPGETKRLSLRKN